MTTAQDLEEQIQALRKSLYQIPATVSKTVEDEDAKIRRIFQEEMSKLQTSLSSTPAVSSANKVLAAVGSALNEDEQVWISQPNNQVRIADFLSTAEGQAITRRFLMTYKEYLCK